MFIKQPTAKSGTIALLPATMKLVQGMPDPHHYGPPEPDWFFWSLYAYWHETKKGVSTATFGYVHISLLDWGEDFSLLEPIYGKAPEDITYSDLLAFTKFSTLAKDTYIRIGNSRPYSPKQINSALYGDKWEKLILPNISAYDEQALKNMLINPNDLPPHSDGWYSISNKRP